MKKERGNKQIHAVGKLCYNRTMRILKTPITKQELIEASENFIDQDTIKAAVDINRELIAVDAPMHYECEQLLLENGSDQYDIWGINLYLDEDNINEMVEFDSMINIRPTQNNRSRSVEDLDTQAKIKAVVAKWLK